MIPKETAIRIVWCYQEIERAEKLLADMDEMRKRHETPTFPDAFGQRHGLQLGVPMGDDSRRLFQVSPVLAATVIRAHIAEKRSELDALMVEARALLVPPVGGGA